MSTFQERIKLVKKVVNSIGSGQLRETDENRIIYAVAKDNDVETVVVRHGIDNLKTLGVVNNNWKTDKMTKYIEKQKELNRINTMHLNHSEIYHERVKQKKYGDSVSRELIDSHMLANIVLIYMLSDGFYNDKIHFRYGIGSMQVGRILNRLFKDLKYNDFVLIDKNEFTPSDVLFSIRYYKYKNGQLCRSNILKLHRDENFQNLIKKYGSDNLLMTYEYVRKRCISILNISSTKEKDDKSLKEWMGL